MCRMARSAVDRATKIYIKPLRSEAEAEADILNANGELVRQDKVKMQYVHLQNIADTSIKRTISVQSSPMQKKSCI